MAVIERVICDACELDLTTSAHCEQARLELSLEPMPQRPGFTAEKAVRQRIDRTHHFCGLGCLWKWLAAVKAKCDEESERFVRGYDEAAKRAEHEAEWRSFNDAAWWDNGGGGW